MTPAREKEPSTSQTMQQIIRIDIVATGTGPSPVLHHYFVQHPSETIPPSHCTPLLDPGMLIYHPRFFVEHTFYLNFYPNVPKIVQSTGVRLPHICTYVLTYEKIRHYSSRAYLQRLVIRVNGRDERQKEGQSLPRARVSVDDHVLVV